MDKAKISLTIECVPDMAARLPQAVALVDLLLNNGRIEARELPSALLAMLLETSRLIEAGTLPADDGKIWELVETASEVVAEQVRAVLTGPAPAPPALIKLNGTDGTPDYLDDDDDNDGILTADEIGGAQSCGDAPDCDGDGVPDYLDTDSDDDGEPDGTDATLECVSDVTGCGGAQNGICLPIICKESN